MFVGDSMTIGCAGDFTWRYRMWQHLRRYVADDFAVVGPRSALHDPAVNAPVSHAYRDPAFPEHARRHLAGWGEGWRHLAPAVESAVLEHRADLLLISLGLIDLGFYTRSEETVEQVRRFFQAARSANPRISAVLLPVVPNIRAEDDALFADECRRFNVSLAKVVADLDSAASPLCLASSPAGYDVRRDTYDGTHPNESGEHLLAAAFADTLHQAWEIGGRYALSESLS